MRPSLCPIGKLSSQNTPQNQPNQHNAQRQRISINRIIDQKPEIPHPQHLRTQRHKSNSKKQNKYNATLGKPATHSTGRPRIGKHILPRNGQRANNKTTQNITHNADIDSTAQTQIRQKNKTRSRASQRSPQRIDTIEKTNSACNSTAIARILTTKKRKRTAHQNRGRQNDERNQKETDSEPQEGRIAQDSIRDTIEKICKIKRIGTDQSQDTQTNLDISKKNKRPGTLLTNAPKKIRTNSQTQKKNRQNRTHRKRRGPKQKRGLSYPGNLVNQPGKTRQKKTYQRGDMLRGSRRFPSAFTHILSNLSLPLLYTITHPPTPRRDAPPWDRLPRNTCPLSDRHKP